MMVEEQMIWMSAIQTVDKIDLTNYKYLYLKCGTYIPSGGQRHAIKITLLKETSVYTMDNESGKYSLTNAAYELKESSGDSNILNVDRKETLMFDISDISGKYYIGIKFEGNGAIQMHIRNMWIC